MDSLQGVDFKALGKQMEAERQEVLKRLRANEIDGRTCATSLSRITDRYLIEGFSHSFAAFPEHVGLILGGAAGREVECPGSDLDPVVLISDEVPEGFNASCEAFYYALDPRDGLNFTSTGSTRYMTLGEISNLVRQKDDFTLHTTLLNRRLLWGSDKLSGDLAPVVKQLNTGDIDFVRRNLAEREARLGKEKNSPHLVTPNIKEGYGGLRDYEMLLWMGKVLNGGNGMPDLIKHNLISPAEARELEEAYNFLLTVRCHLHDVVILGNPGVQKGNKKHISDVLHVEHQADIAKRMRISPERLMQSYYKASRTIGHLTNVLSAGIYEHVTSSRLSAEGFSVSPRALRFKDGVVINPVQMLDIFRASQLYGFEPHHSAVRAIGQNLGQVDRAFRSSPEANKIFLGIMTGPGGGRALRQMQEVGLLSRFDPDFAEIEALREFDKKHAYTVDERTFRGLGFLEKIRKKNFGPNDPEIFALKLASKLNESDWRVLSVAIYLHDIRKDQEPDPTNPNHHIEGAKLARARCPVLGLNADETEKVAWLIENHLRLPHMAQTMSPDVPETIQLLAKHIPSAEHLDLLAVLAAVDGLSIAPGHWNQFKNTQIEEFYNNTRTFIVQKELVQEKSLYIPSKYKTGEIRVDLRTIFEGSANELVTVSPDRPFLFEDIVATLGMNGYNIQTVESGTHRNGISAILNRFTFTSANGRSDGAALDSLRAKITAAIQNNERADYAKIKRDPVARTIPVKPFVRVSNDIGQQTHVHVSGRDRPYLVLDLARAFNGLDLNITFACLDATGDTVNDGFYLTKRDGSKVEGHDAHNLYEAAFACVRE